MLRMSTLPAGFIEPCLPTKADKLPSGGLWVHEIKHDGFRVIARKDGPQVRLYSRPGNDLTERFSLIVEALARLRSRSCIIDGQACALTRWKRITRRMTVQPLTAAAGTDGGGRLPSLRRRWAKRRLVDR
jgi:bifunctional non-homologous end joining protein LigD